MKVLGRMFIAMAVLCFMVVGSANAQGKGKGKGAGGPVTLSGVHLCCGGCEKGVAAAVAKVDGAEVSCDKDAGTVTLKASSRESGMAAMKAIMEAGYHGKVKSGSRQLPLGKAPEGMVKSLKLKGVHNCCGKCEKAIHAAIGKVKGAKAGTLEKKSRVFEVTGNFNAKALMKAFGDVGMHVEVAK